MYDPFTLSRKIESIVCQGSRRKYYRFRPAGFYGGIATADYVKRLAERLSALTPDFDDLEIEEVICYPRVQQELERAGLVIKGPTNVRDIS